MKNIKNIIEEMRLLGVKGSLFRIYYELMLRMGIRAFDVQIDGSPEIDLTIDHWRKTRKNCFFPPLPEARETLHEILTEDARRHIIDIADKAISGKILCFSKWFGDFGNPLKWHFNPRRDVLWPSDVHWSKVFRYEQECGDIKLTWELNRFPHTYYYVRAFALTGDVKYVNAFTDQLKSWEEFNNYPYGINWNSAQELAIRLLSWIFAVYSMGDSPAFRDEDLMRFLRMLYLHAKHIEKNIRYAYYAVHNNHLIGEALALYAAGALFPYFSESERWKEKGKELLLGDRCFGQFYSDGGYCQLSFNYQRLAMHYYLWFLRIAEAIGDRFDDTVTEILDSSSKFLSSFISKENGQLPNWGTNDGALLNPWTACDFTDYRPLINALSYITRKKRAFETGIWDEELFWFFGRESLKSDVVPYSSEAKSYPVTGLHIIRASEKTYGVFRCGSVIDRFGQADQLNFDLWWQGQNIAVDGGSYLYNDELRYHHYFHGTGSHNTVVVDNRDQMYLHRRFKWLYWTRAELLVFGNRYMEGEHYGYARLKGTVTHRRSVELLNENSFLIKDSLQQEKRYNHEYNLHWLLNDYPYEIEKKNPGCYVIILETPEGEYFLCLKGNSDAEIIVNGGLDRDELPDGWQSRYYGEKKPVLSIHLICESPHACTFTSLFSASKELIFNRNKS